MITNGKENNEARRDEMKADTNTLSNLSEHLAGNITEATAMEANENGASLWMAEDANGEIRYVIEGETGELLGAWEDEDEARAAWDGPVEVTAEPAHDLAERPNGTGKKLRGMKAAMAAYDGHDGPVTVSAVLGQIPQELRNRLTGHELGLVMSAVNGAYHNGRASHGGLDLCDDCVWVPWGGGVKTECGACQTDDPAKCRCVDKIGGERGQLIPIEALRRVKHNGHRYTLDYTE